MQSDTSKRLIFGILLLLCLASFFLVVFLGYLYNHSSPELLEIAREDVRSQARNASESIGIELGKLKEISESLSHDLSTSGTEENQTVNKLKKIITKNPDIYGIFAA